MDKNENSSAELVQYANNYWRANGDEAVLRGDAAMERRVSRMLARSVARTPKETAETQEDFRLSTDLSAADNLLSCGMKLFAEAYVNLSARPDIDPQKLKSGLADDTFIGGISSDEAEDVAGMMNTHRSAKPDFVDALSAIFNPDFNNDLYQHTGALATRVANEFERSIATARALSVTQAAPVDPTVLYVQAMKALMEQLPREFVDKVLKPRIPVYSEKQGLPLTKRQEALHHGLVEGLRQGADNKAVAVPDVTVDTTDLRGRIKPRSKERGDD